MAPDAEAAARYRGGGEVEPDQEEARMLAIAVEAARLRVDETSLRSTAREIGMSPTGLRGVLDGTEPYGRTRERLRAWIARVRGLGEVPGQVAENTVVALLRRLPEPHRGAALLLEFVEELHRREGVDVPIWIADVRSRLSQALVRMSG